MVRVDIEDLKPGMILEHPVKNSQGVLLLEAGAKVNKKNIRIFKSWGVTEVTVKGRAARDNGPTDLQQSQIEAFDEMILKEKFADVLDDPVMVEIFKAAGRQLAKDLPDDDER